MSWLSTPYFVTSVSNMFTTSTKKQENLRERIEKLNATVKTTLQEARIDDNQLLTLTREDLNELFPGIKNFQLRGKILGLITEANQPPRASAETLANTLKDLIQRNDRGGPAAEGVIRDYLYSLRDLEKQLTTALDFLKPHIKLLEFLSEVPKATSSAVVLKQTHTERREQNWTLFEAPSPSPPHAVKIHSLVSGNTLGAHDVIIRRLQLVQPSSLEHCRVILLFCPMASRANTDIEFALLQVQDSKPTILVLLHHTHDKDHIGVQPSTCSYNNVNVVECVNVLFHETTKGLLLECNANTQAIARIQSALQQFK